MLFVVVLRHSAGCHLKASTTVFALRGIAGRCNHIAARPWREPYLAWCNAQVKVFWPAMGRWYIGKVKTFDAKSGKHTVQFKDGDKREYIMRHEAVVWLDVPGLEGASAAAMGESGWQEDEVCILACAYCNPLCLQCAVAFTCHGYLAVIKPLQQLDWSLPSGVRGMQGCAAVPSER